VRCDINTALGIPWIGSSPMVQGSPEYVAVIVLPWQLCDNSYFVYIIVW